MFCNMKHCLTENFVECANKLSVLFQSNAAKLCFQSFHLYDVEDISDTCVFKNL